MVAETSAPASAVKRTSEDLAEVMRRRREQCTVLESAPEASTADYGTSRKNADQSGSETQVWESNPGESAADVAATKVAAPTTTAASSSSAPVRQYVPRASPANKLPAASDGDVSRWMEKIRNRCQVYESLPETGSADFQWSADTPVQKGEQAAPRAVARLPSKGSSSVARSTAAGAGGVDGLAQTASTDGAVLPEDSASLPKEDAAATNLVSNPLEAAERIALWQEHLKPAGAAQAAPAVRKLLSLVHPDDPTAEDLADAFAERYVPFIAEDGAATSFTSVCRLLAQLMRYHFPRLSACVELAGSEGSNSSLQTVLARVCGSTGSALADRLLAVDAPAQASLLLSMCDTMVLEGRDTLLLFILLALLGATEADLRSDTTAEAVEANWAEAIASLQSRGPQQMAEIVDMAHDLYEATPVCRSSAWPLEAPDQKDSKVCSVSPDEVLRHIYEQPATSWRFVVADVRSTVNLQYALPVSVRIEASEDRATVLAEMPYEECIHLCLVADGPPSTADDEAFRLSAALVDAPTYRKHVSVVEGGWPAIQSLVQSMGLDLMDVELEVAAEAAQEEAEAADEGTQSQAGVESFRTAAAALGQKMARRSQKLTHGIIKNTTKALKKFSEDINEITENLSQTGKRSRRREVEFVEGTLGFDIQGNVVKLVDADGQAAAGGVKAGDRLVAVEGREVPTPPETDPQEVREQRVKRLIKRWIKEHRRPVKLTFESAPAVE